MDLLPILASSLIARQVLTRHMRPSMLSAKLRLHLSCVRQLLELAREQHRDEAWVLVELIKATGGATKSPWMRILELSDSELHTFEQQTQEVDSVQFYSLCSAGLVSPAAKVVVWQCFMESPHTAEDLSLTMAEINKLLEPPFGER